LGNFLGNSAAEDATRGNIEQRGDDRWRLRVFAGRENGRMKLVTRSFQGTKRQAGTALAKLVTEVEQGQVAKHHPGTLADLLDRWLETVAPERSPYTMKEYRRMATTSIKPAIGTVPLAKLTGARLDTFYRSLTDRGLSSASVRRHHFLLHAALGRAVKWGMVPLNPADGSTPPGLSHSTVSAPDVADVQRLIRETETIQPILAAAIALAAVTGARRGELCALRWSDVNWARRLLMIARSLTVIDGVATEGPTKTHQRRGVALDDAMLALLRKRRADQEAYARQVGLVADPFVLSSSASGGQPYQPDTLTDYYKRAAKKLGITTHFHELRHFAATTAIAGGADVRTVAGRLGHADASVTLRVYAHALEARDRELASFLGSVVLGAVDGGPKLDEADPPAPPELESAG
jgi:integrase